MFPRSRQLKLSIIKQIEILSGQKPDVISLAQGIPSFDTPGCIKRRVERALQRGVVAKYSLSPGLPELRELIEISLAQDKMFYDWQKEIIVTAGSIEAITATILTITEPGDEVIIFDPTYTSYQEVIKLAGCTPVFAVLNESDNWGVSLDKVVTAITPKTKAILYCNPNNPTGTIFSKEQLLGLAELSQRHNLYLIADEVYKDFIYDRNDYFSLAQIPNLRKKIIRVYSFSKSYAMTGWRVGYLHSDEAIIKEILKVHDCLVTCAPVISQYAALGALEMGEGDIKIFKDNFTQRRALVCQRLDELKQYFSYVEPGGAYFVFPKIIDNGLMAKLDAQDPADGLSWRLTKEFLEKIQVAVVPGIAFGPSGENHLRINFGRNENDINRGFERISGFLNRL